MLSDCTYVLGVSYSHWVRDRDLRHISDASAEAVAALIHHIEPDDLLKIVQTCMEMGYAIALKDHRDGKLGDLEYCQYHADNVILFRRFRASSAISTALNTTACRSP
jgi:hypothetical protein